MTTHLEDFLCAQTLEYSAIQNNSWYISYFTATPSITVLAPSCGSSYASFTNATGFVVQTTPLLLSEEGCILRNTSQPNNLLMTLVLAGMGSSQEFTLKRRPPDNIVFFARHVSAAVYQSPNARIDVQLTSTYPYPNCCGFPTTFLSDAYVFTQISAIGQCGVPEVVTYRLLSADPTTKTFINDTYELWTFDFTDPSNSSCGGTGNTLTDPFSASVYVRLPPKPHILPGLPEVNGGIVAGIVITVLFFLVLVLLGTHAYLRRRERKQV